MNLTCLVPTENPEVGRPERLDLHQMLWYALKFRLDVVTARLEHELNALKTRIHILEGFEKVFDALDEILKIVRKSDGKADAAAKIIARFHLDDAQADAILELKIYRLARLEILVITNELAEKRKRARQISGLLRSEQDRWDVVRDEIAAIQKAYADPKTNPRRTAFATDDTDIEFSEDDFIVEEDAVVIVSRDGWVKRQKEVKDLSTTRLREGDLVLSVLPGSTRATVVFFSNFGTAYTCRIVDVPASTGYGEPIQKLFKFKDGERIVGACSLDPRMAKRIAPAREGAVPPEHALAVTTDGCSLRFGLDTFVEPSTRAGRSARPSGDAEVVGVVKITGEEVVIAATRSARAMLTKADEVNYLSGPGRGVILIKLHDEDDQVLGFIASTGDRDLLTVETSRGAEQTISTTKVRGDRPRRPRPRAAPARSVHADRAAAARSALARVASEGTGEIFAAERTENTGRQCFAVSDAARTLRALRDA